MDCFCLGIQIETITTEILNCIKLDPLIIFYQSGTVCYVVWCVVLPVGCHKWTFDRWVATAPWTALLASLQRLQSMTTSTERLNFGNIRVYLKYALIIPQQLRNEIVIATDKICYGIKIFNVNDTIVRAVENSRYLMLYVSGDHFFLTHKLVTDVGVLKMNIDQWFNMISTSELVDEINQVLTSDNRKNITLLNLRLYGKYQLSSPYVAKIRFYSQS